MGIYIVLVLIDAIIYYFINKKFFIIWTTNNQLEIKQQFTESKTRDYYIDNSNSTYCNKLF